MSQDPRDSVEYSLERANDKLAEIHSALCEISFDRLSDDAFRDECAIRFISTMVAALPAGDGARTAYTVGARMAYDVADAMVAERKRRVRGVSAILSDRAVAVLRYTIDTDALMVRDALHRLAANYRMNTFVGPAAFPEVERRTINRAVSDLTTYGRGAWTLANDLMRVEQETT